MKAFLWIALIALVITVIVTVTGTLLLLKYVKRLYDGNVPDVLRPEHIKNRQTEEDWKAWDDDPWKKDEWAEEWDSWEERDEK